MAFNSGVTIYPVVSDASTGFPTTIFPYIMRHEDAPKGGFRRKPSVTRAVYGDKASYVDMVNKKAAKAGSYNRWLDLLEIEAPSSKLVGNVITGGTLEDWREARVKAQRAYDLSMGVGVSDASPESGLSMLLDEAGDAAGSAASSVQSYVREHPGKAVAWVVGAGVVVYLLARSGRR